MYCLRRSGFEFHSWKFDPDFFLHVDIYNVFLRFDPPIIQDLILGVPFTYNT